MNLLEAEKSIVQRLKQTVAEGPNAWAREVGTRDVLASVTEEMQNCPAVYVVYGGPIVFDADDKRASIGHRFFVIVAVKNAAQGREAAPRNQDAGPLVGSVLSALHGFVCKGATHGLIPATPPAPHYSEGGTFAYYPLAFVARAYHSTRFGLAEAAA